MSRKSVYLLFCVLGIVLPYSQFVPWVMEHGLNLKLFVQQLFANRIGGFFGMDVLVSAVVLIFFMRREGQRLGVRQVWLPDCGRLRGGRQPWSAAVSLFAREGHGIAATFLEVEMAAA